MHTVSGYLSERLAQHARPSDGWRRTIDTVLLDLVRADLTKHQRVELPLSHVREDAIRSDPLLTAYATDDDVYVRETIKDYAARAFRADTYPELENGVDPRLSAFGSQNARLIKHLAERISEDGQISGGRFALTAFETSYRMQYELLDQQADVATLERTTSDLTELGPKAPMNALTTTFKQPNPLLNWTHDALIDYHEYRFLTEAIEHRGHEHLKADSLTYLADHFARKTIMRLLSTVAIAAAPHIERELFPGDQAAPTR